MRVAFNPAARRELVETARWYTNEAGGLRADDFRKEVQRSLKLIVEQSRAGRDRGEPYPQLASASLSLLPNLSHRRRHIARAGGFHHSRRPGYWAGRR